MSSTELRALDSLISSPVKRNALRIGEWCLRVEWKGSSDSEDSGPRGAGGPTHCKTVLEQDAAVSPELAYSRGVGQRFSSRGS